MPDMRIRVLIVDDEPSIRSSMSQVLTHIGYDVRSADDGFSALLELRREVPDILLSDLCMPGMSGFELLSVVRRRFPWLQTIAMSGAFSGDEVPAGVAADAFYQKGCGVASLMKIMGALPGAEADAAQFSNRAGAYLDSAERTRRFGKGIVTIACPKCLRTFPQTVDGSIYEICETGCIFCRSSIRYAVIELSGRASVVNRISV